MALLAKCGRNVGLYPVPGVAQYVFRVGRVEKPPAPQLLQILTATSYIVGHSPFTRSMHLAYYLIVDMPHVRETG